MGDVTSSKNKPKKRKRKVLVENTSSETNIVFDAESCLMSLLKDSDCWPDSGKQEGVDEVFSDDEPFNSPIHNYEESNIVQDEPLNIDISSTFDTVLRGDPSFICEDVVSSEDYAVWNNAVQSNKKSLFDSNGLKNKLNDTISDAMDSVNLAEKCKEVSDSNVPLLSRSSSGMEIDKQMILPFFSDDLLNTCQLDEILNEDLNKGLDSICENNSHHELTVNPFEESSNPEK